MDETTLRVLVVDDEENFRESLAEYLRTTHNYLVDTAADGEVTLHMIDEAQGHYDVVLIDEVLEGDSQGIDVLKHIKLRYQEIEVILFTGGELQTGIEALRAGAYRFFAKPFNRVELAFTVRFAAEQRHLRQERNYLEALVVTSRGLARTTQWTEQLALIGDFLHVKLGVPSFFVALRDLESDTLSFQIGSNQTEREIANHVMKTGKELFCSTRSKYEQTCRSLGIISSIEGESPQSIFCVPLEIEDKISGVLSIGSDQAHAFDDVMLLNAVRTLSQTVSVVLEKSRNARRRREVELLRLAAETITLEDKLQNVLRNIVQSAKKIMEADYSIIWPYNEAADQFVPEEIVAEGDLIPDGILEELKSEEPGFTIRRILSEKYLEVTDIRLSGDRIGLHTLETLRKYGIASFLGIRLDARQYKTDTIKKMGVLVVDYKRPRSFSSEDIRILESFSNQAAFVLNNARLLDQATRSRETAKSLTQVKPHDNLENTLINIGRAACDALLCDFITVYVFDESVMRFILATGVGQDPANIKDPNTINPESRVWKVMNLTDQPYLLSADTLDGDFLQGYALKAEGVKSYIGIKLRHGDERVGVMFFNYRRKHTCSAQEIEDAIMFGNQAAIAIHNTYRYREIENWAGVLERLYNAGKAITSTLSLMGTLELVCQTALQIVGSICQHEGCFSYVMMNKDDGLEVVSAYPPEMRDALKSFSISLGANPTSIAGQAFLTGDPQNVPDVQSRPGNIPTKQNTKSQISVPLRLGGNIIGVLSIEHPNPASFKNEDQRNLELFSTQAALAIQNARVHRETEGLLEARTSLAWTGMISATWGHAIGRYAQTIREQVQHLRRDLKKYLQADNSNLENRLSMIERLASQILEKRITRPLSKDDGVSLLPINEFVKERSEQLWKYEPYRDLQLKLDLRLDDSAAISASPEWLRRVLDILVDNVVDATKKYDVRRVTITTTQLGNKIKIALRDNGRGIPPDVMKNLFHVPIPKPEGSKGHGAGLLLAQTIVQTYGGEIIVENTSAEGTTMSILFPLQA